MAADPRPAYLGRPWKEFSRGVVMQSEIGDIIKPEGWKEWSGDFALSTLHYGEYANTGPSSGTDDRVQWPTFHRMTKSEAEPFTVANFILGDDWLPATGIPYDSGL